MNHLNKPINTILFDFDGTLAPNLDLPDMRRQVIGLTEQHQVPADVYADCYIVEVIDAAHQWLNSQDASKAQSYHAKAHQLITDFEVDAAKKTAPFPGITNKLNELRTRRINLAVVTRNCRAAVLAVFPDLLNHVDYLYARDDTTHLKPDPRHLKLPLEQFDCDPVQAAMVGDGALDMSAGRELGMYCIGVLSGSADGAKLKNAGAHLVLPDCLALTL